MSHAPKLFALEAHVAGLLSAAGEARLARHLHGCETCRAALDAVRSYAQLRDEARAAEPAELAWERLEAALDAGERTGSLDPLGDRPRSLPAKSRAGRALALAWPVLAVAATALIIWIGLSGQQQAAELARRAPVAQPALERAPALEGVVTLLRGSVERERQGARTALTLGESVREGDRLFTAELGGVHVALADGSGFAVEGASEVSATVLRADDVVLGLTRGALTSQVRKLGASERYVVEGRTFSAHVRGTRFTVREGASFAVRVAEGRVEVMKGPASIAVLEAGQSWDSGGANPEAPDHEPRVHGVGVAMDGWSSLMLPVDARIARWQLGDIEAPATAELSMRAPLGSRSVAFVDLRGKLHTLTLEVLPEGTRLSEDALTHELAPPREADGFLPPDQISDVVKSGLGRLRQCYERSLRGNPRFESKPVLAIRVAADGHVARASLSAEGIPPELEQCVLNEARTWKFPRPEGGPLSFEVPLKLRARD